MRKQQAVLALLGFYFPTASDSSALIWNSACIQEPLGREKLCDIHWWLKLSLRQGLKALCLLRLTPGIPAFYTLQSCTLWALL